MMLQWLFGSAPDFPASLIFLFTIQVQADESNDSLLRPTAGTSSPNQGITLSLQIRHSLTGLY